MLLLSLVPLSFVFVLYALLYRNISGGHYTKIRLALLQSILLSSSYLVLVTELLSSYRLISFWWIFLSWLVPMLIMLLFTVRKNIFFSVSKETFTNLHMVLVGSGIARLILFFIIVSLGLAILYPPNNYDSLTYHMARVAHWVENSSIDHYRTHIIRQLIFPPFAEWVILHLQVLTAGDTLANGVQLFFFAACILNVSLVAKELGGSCKLQLLAALFACLIPMAIIQSNTTQNDIVVAYFVSSFVFLTICATKSFSFPMAFFAGTALGLAWLTKGTGYLFTVLFCAWYVLILVKGIAERPRQLLNRAALIVMIPFIAVIINSGHYYRNTQLSGSPLGNAGESTINEGYSPSQLTLIGIKNVMNHMPVTAWVKYILVSRTRNWGIDINDPKYSHGDISWMKEGFSFNEDYAQNFTHTILIMVLGIAWIFKRGSYFRTNRIYALFGISIFASALLFCITLKWQPWSNRLEICLYFLISVVLALEIGSMKKGLQILCFIPMLGFGIGALMWSPGHRLLPVRKSILFRPYESFMYEEQHLWCLNYIKANGYKIIGLYIGSDDRDYIFYKLLQEDNPERIIKHVIVRNKSEEYIEEFYPEIIISSDETPISMKVGNITYVRKVIFMPRLAIFVKEGI